MSGGALSYSPSKLIDLADEIERKGTTVQHRAFAEHLRKVAAAVNALDKLLASDAAKGSEIEAIDACIDPRGSLLMAIQEARVARTNLSFEIERAIGDYRYNGK